MEQSDVVLKSHIVEVIVDNDAVDAAVDMSVRFTCFLKVESLFEVQVPLAIRRVYDPEKF